MNDKNFMVFSGDPWSGRGFNAYRGINSDIDQIKKSFEDNDDDSWCQIVDMDKWEVVCWGNNFSYKSTKWEWEDEKQSEMQAMPGDYRELPPS